MKSDFAISMSLGIKTLDYGMPAIARIRFKQALAIKPFDHIAHRMMGKTYLASQKFCDAIQ